jgi:cytochrome oxidase Cu insertion factor (SCO1/SenC/PrrC family)
MTNPVDRPPDPSSDVPPAAGVKDPATAGTRSTRRRRLIMFNCLFGVSLLVLAGVGAAFWLRPAPAAHAATADASQLLPLDTPAPNFDLTGQFGQPVTLNAYRGKAVVISFVDSQCTTICPLTTSTMTAAADSLGADSSRVQLLGINANPLATSVSDVHAYSKAHDLLYRWDFLTAGKARLSSVWRDYHVYAAAIGNNIDHDPAVFVIDPAGRERAIFHTEMAYSSVTVQAAQLAAALRATLGLPTGGFATPAPTSVLLPSVHATFPVAAGTPKTAVEIGPGHPHLIVFLASWLTELSDLKAGIAALNDYQRMALQKGLPSLVAVDLTTTEPQHGSLARTLQALGAQPRFPIVLDQNGAIADGYGAQDAPWFSLTGRNGTPVWQHDGWLTVAALEKAVTKATGS